MRKHDGVLIGVLGLALLLAACPNPMAPDNGDEGEDPIQVTGVSLAGSLISVVAGGSSQLSAAVLPGNATDPRVQWSSSDPGVATVDDTGLVEGISTGSAVITVTTLDGGFAAACVVNVLGAAVDVTGVGLNKTSTIIAVGGSERLDAIIFPVDATDPRVSWSSNDPGIASVSAAGVVTAMSPGTAEVTVEILDGGFEASCTVQVTSTPVAVTGIVLAKSSTTLLIGHGEQLAAAVTPSQATNQGILWSTSDGATVAVSPGGFIAGLQEGSAVVTATSLDGGFAADCSVDVVSSVVDVTGVTITSATTEIFLGTSEQLLFTIDPGSATDQRVTWDSSNEDVVRVSATGVVEAVWLGSAVITVTAAADPLISDTRTLTVKPPVAVTGVSVDPDSAVLAVEETTSLAATIVPVDATVKAVTWESSNETVATVSSSGLVEAVGLGYATITATAVDDTAGGPHADTCAVTVAGMSLDGTTMELEVGGTESLTVTVVPKAGPVPTVTWSSSNDKVATVADGSVTAVNAGTAVIRASASDGDGGTFEETCTVTVTGVYVAGYAQTVAGEDWEAACWVATSSGSVRTDLPSEGSTWARDVCVLDGDVFVTGNYNGAEVGTPCYWKNGTRSDLPVPDGTAFGIGGGVVSNGTYVLVAGFYSNGTNSTACYWRIEPGESDSVVRFDLDTAYGSAFGAAGFGIAVADGSVYVSGAWVDGGVQKACYWVDDGLDGLDVDYTVLHDPAYDSSLAYDIVVESGYVYSGGFHHDDDAGVAVGCYWIDGSMEEVEGTDSYPYALCVSQTGVAYMAGMDNYAGCYWVATAKETLSPAGYAYGITFQGDDLYVSGDTDSGTPSAKACYWKNGVHQDLDSPGESGAMRIRAY